MMKTKTKTELVICCGCFEAFMHGVARYALSGERTVTLGYTDGTTETGLVPQKLADAIRAYVEYQEGDGPACEAPNSFSVIGWVQGGRKDRVGV